jgi:hypothetical protein
MKLGPFSDEKDIKDEEKDMLHVLWPGADDCSLPTEIKSDGCRKTSYFIRKSYEISSSVQCYHPQILFGRV